jgi:serine/threonine-protein phosphatase PPG1
MGFDLDKWLSKALAGELLPEQAIGVLVGKLKEVLFEEENLVQVEAPVTCVGDIHGQFYDLL